MFRLPQPCSLSNKVRRNHGRIYCAGHVFVACYVSGTGRCLLQRVQIHQHSIVFVCTLLFTKHIPYLVSLSVVLQSCICRASPDRIQTRPTKPCSMLMHRAQVLGMCGLRRKRCRLRCVITRMHTRVCACDVCCARPCTKSNSIMRMPPGLFRMVPDRIHIRSDGITLASIVHCTCVGHVLCHAKNCNLWRTITDPHTMPCARCLV